MQFSVIIPTYHRIDFLERAIQSVINQTYQDYEIIVVNDNPADKESIDKLIAQFEKTRVIHHTLPRGGNAARNSGIIHSKGELIAFLDDDDLWLPEKLALHQKEHQRDPAIGLVFSDCNYVYNHIFIKDTFAPHSLPKDVLGKMKTAEFCPATSSMVSIKRACVEKCGLFDDTLVSLQDWDYWFRIAHFFKFSHIPVMLVLYKQHLGDRTSNNENKRRKGLEQIAKKWKDEIDISVFKKNIFRNLYFKNSRNALIAGEKFTAFKKSFKLLRRGVISRKSIKLFLVIMAGIITRKRMARAGD